MLLPGQQTADLRCRFYPTPPAVHHRWPDGLPSLREAALHAPVERSAIAWLPASAGLGSRHSGQPLDPVGHRMGDERLPALPQKRDLIVDLTLRLPLPGSD